ncbi:hypothetical protein [Allosphingosinicella deserti]|uniref:hypothetical protein n=1 Tax=Allosphingosinicella deserti TaxID=2116704 RepID=UPI000D0BE8F7|nr:hypothetical protein [Sphingomonas deserti]
MNVDRIAIDDLADALRMTLGQLRVTGELDLTIGDERSVSFIGTPNGRDMIVSVRVMYLDDDADPR